MSFSKNDLEQIKNKIRLSSELENKVKIIKKGNDYWCCCPFHEEKTPSCKINDDLGSYYCFGCGAKGDIFTIYTELYNYTFPDAVRDLAKRVGINISENNFKQNTENEKVFKILELSTQWFEKNLQQNDKCKQYLKKRSLSNNTIKNFRIGYSSNSSTTLYQFLKENNFKDEDILKSNVIKKDKNNKIKDFFYKRLMFPIINEQNKIVGFGGRVLDNSNPKYINSPESNIFQKRSILYNLNHAKNFIRSKQNMLICEGYMDVISLYENNIKTAVAPLGTALTENQLTLSWKYVNKPTIMFDGDNSGLKASFKSALMALPFLSPEKYLQFIKLPLNYDPDSYINEFSLNKFVSILKKPLPLVNFIFEQSSSTIDLNIADNKVTFDKYIDDIVEKIKNKKVQYFYKNEFKSLFFEKLKSKKKFTKKNYTKNPNVSLIDKQISSFLAAYINHPDIRDKLNILFEKFNIFNKDQREFINFFQNNEYKNFGSEKIKKINLSPELGVVYNKIMENSIFQLFPYSRMDNNSNETLKEIEESLNNLNTRLSNLKKINKSLDEFDINSSSITWEELKKITSDFYKLEEQ